MKAFACNLGDGGKRCSTETSSGAPGSGGRTSSMDSAALIVIIALGAAFCGCAAFATCSLSMLNGKALLKSDGGVPPASDLNQTDEVVRVDSMPAVPPPRPDGNDPSPGIATRMSARGVAAIPVGGIPVVGGEGP